MLEKAQIPPPYVLVGHSLGGFNVRVFAGRYPNEVAGMVLIDSSHPDQWARYAGIVPRKTPTDGPLLNRFRRQFGTLNLIGGIDLKASAVQVRDINWLGTKPLVVVSRSPHSMPVPTPRLPADVTEEMEKIWSELPARLIDPVGQQPSGYCHSCGPHDPDGGAAVGGGCDRGRSAAGAGGDTVTTLTYIDGRCFAY